MIAPRNGVTAAVLAALLSCAACSSSGDAESADQPAAHSAPSHTASSTTGARVPLSLVPEGTAVIAAGDKPYVVAQPSPGSFVAFDASCAGAESTVAAEDGLILTCADDGSVYDGATGAVRSGPATSALVAIPIRLDGAVLVVG